MFRSKRNTSQYRQLRYLIYTPFGMPLRVFSRRTFLSGIAALAVSQTVPSLGQDIFTSKELADMARGEAQHEGDAPEQTLPLARLSPELKASAVKKAIKKVAGWELARSQRYFNQDWTFAALYTGFMAASEATGQPRYRDAMLTMGNRFDWKLGPRLEHADDQCIGQTYLELYSHYHAAKMIAPLRAEFDTILALPVAPNDKLPWWWCDALFMAPPVWAGLARATGERKYLEFMNREWWRTSAKLYDAEEHLFYRDATFIPLREKNGKKVFWSRGNGWVMAGLARVLTAMPRNYPDRARYVEQFEQMAEAIRNLQCADGLWRSGLLDAASYSLPEVSGSSFFVYALAWGLNQGLLDRPAYEPVILRAWKGLLQHVYEDGRLGCIQQVGARPAHFKATSSYVYGVGAFLLAGSEVIHVHKA
ncbi:MAG TPA: glycoside hydrolase family 88 protein [Terriglobales bacterium]|nr:glycoside hydrolase family 88 protein [Terriglobales bacterium]